MSETSKMKLRYIYLKNGKKITENDVLKPINQGLKQIVMVKEIVIDYEKDSYSNIYRELYIVAENNVLKDKVRRNKYHRWQENWIKTTKQYSIEEFHKLINM